MKSKLAIYWCRRDFRLSDNPALCQAINFAKKNQIPLLPIFILDNFLLNSETNLDINPRKNDEKSGSNSQNNLPAISPKFHNIGLPRRLILSRILASFSLQFASFGINFEIFLGDFQSVFQVLAENFELFVFTNEDIEPFSRTRDLAVSDLIGKKNFFASADQLTVSPDLRTGNGTIYSIFTPFKNAAWESFLNAKTMPKVELEKEKFLFLDANNSIYTKVQNIFNITKDEKSTKTQNLAIQLQNQILFKKDSFQDLQTQIYGLIETKWQFVIAKHNSKSNSHNLQNLDNDQTKKIPQKILDKNSDFISESEGNFVINLENILDKSYYLQWNYQESQVLVDFEDFLETKIENYKENRDSLDLDTIDNGQTSKMSYALKWGLVSSRTLKQKIVDKFGLQITSQNGVVHFLNELIWREFYRYILFHEPLVLDTEFQPRFRQKIEQNELENLKEKLSEQNIAKLLEN